MVIDSVLGPWRPDLPAQGNPGVTEVNNVLPAIGSASGSIAYDPMSSESLYSSTTLASRPLGAISGQDTIGNGKVYAADSSKLYKLSPSDLNWTDISRTSSAYGESSEAWEFAKYGTWVVGSNFNNYPQYIDMNVDANFDDLTTLVKARHITTSRGFVVVGNTNDAFDGDIPYRIRWSGLNAPQDWDFSITTQADFQDIDGGGGVIQRIVGGEDVTVFMKDSIYKMTYVGTPLIWQFDEVVKGKGCKVPQSVVTVEGVSYFLSDDGFYSWNGSLSRIGEGKIDNWFLSTVDTSQYQYMSTASDPDRKIVYWCFASQAAVNGIPDTFLIYNYGIGEWAKADSGGVAFLYNGASLPWTIEQLDQFGTIENVPAPLDSSIWAGGNGYLAGMNNAGNVFVFSGPNKTGVIETAEQYLIRLLQQQNPNTNGDQTVVLRLRVMVDGSGDVSCRVGSRVLSQGNLTWSLLSARDLNTGWCNIRQQGRFHRARIVLTGDYSQASGIQFDAVSAGYR